MPTAIALGTASDASSAKLEFEKLLASRLLVQGKSGSGKSNLLRRLLEQRAGCVQQEVIDPEGDFISLAEPYGHLVIEGADYTEADIAGIAARVRQKLEHRAAVQRPVPVSTIAPADLEDRIDAVLSDIIADGEGARPTSALYQDFVVCCRIRQITQPPLTLPEFEGRFSLAKAGFYSAQLSDPSWAPAIALADTIPDDMLAVFMLFVRAARERGPCLTDAEIAQVYGTQSLGHTRRLLSYMEGRGYLALRTDFRAGEPQRSRSWAGPPASIWNLPRKKSSLPGVRV